MKKCTCCKITKPYEEYHSKGNGKFATRCKICCSELNKIRYKHKKKIDDECFQNWRKSVLENWLGDISHE